MLKYKRNKNRIGGGYTLSEISRGARLWLSLIMSFLCAATLCCAFLLPILPHNRISADAGTSNAVTVGEIYENSGFDSDNLSLLYKYLTGKDNAGASDVIDMVKNNSVTYKVKFSGISNTTTKNGVVDAETIRNNVDKTGSGKKDIVVTIGGYQWTVVYLSTVDQAPANSNASNGDVVITFWLADGSTLAKKPFAAFQSNDAGSYPGAMYGTSQMRAVVLNNGGAYATSNTALSDPVSQDPSNEWAEFTMDTLDGKNNRLAECIVSPSCLSWQQTQTRNVYGGGVSSQTFNYNNDAYATDIENMASNNMQGFTGYDAWKNDKLWLPSCTEVGNGSTTGDGDLTGVWKTSDGQRASSSSFFTVTRSGNSTNNGHNNVLRSDGVVNLSGTPTSGSGSYTVRPAFHFNLSAALHSHTWGEWTTTKTATCSAKGERIRTCTDCGTEEKEEIAVNTNAHKYATEFTVDLAATCTTAGSQSKHCEYCGDKAEVTVINALEHDWGEWIVLNAATCTESGKQRHSCTRTGCTETEEQTIKAEGHKYVDTVTEPTCTEDGYTSHKCSVCGDEYTDEHKDAAGHSYGEPVWQWGTNNLTAKAKFTCSVCNDEKTLNANVTSESATASCTVAGDTTYTATVNLDGTPYTDTKIVKGQKQPHDSEIVSTTVAPTCTEDGVGQMKCKNCGEEYSGVIPSLGHDFAEEFTEDLAASCTEDGSKSKHCSRCGEKNEVTVIEATGHTGGEAADCLHAQTCAVCGAELAPALGHEWGEWVVTKEATFTENGEKIRECSRCGESETEAIASGGIAENGIEITLDVSFEYGDEINPVATATHGEVVFTYYNSDGEEIEKPTAVGSYKVVARVEENLAEGYTSAEKEAEFEIIKRKVTISIDPVSSEAGEELVEITATVIDGSIVEGETPYKLVCTPDKDTVGEYPITFEYAEGFEDCYEITCENAVYIVSKKAEDESGGGEIDLPVDINVEFKVTQSATANDYSTLTGYKLGYWAQLWYKNDDETLGDEYTDEINCILTLTIPNEIIEAIRSGGEIDREKIAEELKLYYVSDGDLTRIKNFKIAQKADESWQVSFNYNEKFRAEIVFNAPNAEEPRGSNFLKDNWFYFLIGAVVLTLFIIVIVVLSRRRARADDYDDDEYDYDDEDDEEDYDDEDY